MTARSLALYLPRFHTAVLLAIVLALFAYARGGAA